MKYRNIIKINQDLKVFFLEIICLKKIKDGACITNLDEYANVGTHWIALFCKKNEIVYFDSFGVEYILEEIKDFIEQFPGNKNIKLTFFEYKKIIQ